MSVSEVFGREPAQNAVIQRRSHAIADQVAEQQSWLEKKLKPKTVSARYPFKGTPLLYATCAFGSLGDGLFGYNSGTPSASIHQEA